jgi:hypothetical protein
VEPRRTDFEDGLTGFAPAGSGRGEILLGPATTPTHAFLFDMGATGQSIRLERLLPRDAPASYELSFSVRIEALPLPVVLLRITPVEHQTFVQLIAEPSEERRARLTIRRVTTATPPDINNVKVGDVSFDAWARLRIHTEAGDAALSSMFVTLDQQAPVLLKDVNTPTNGPFAVALGPDHLIDAGGPVQVRVDDVRLR